MSFLLTSQDICSDILMRLLRMLDQVEDANIWLSADVIWRVGYYTITGWWLLILMRWHLSNNVTERSDRIFSALSFLLIVAL